MQEDRRIQEDLLLQLLNHRRHDSLNHIQVLLGFVSLGKMDEMREYLQQMKDDLHRDGLISKLGDAKFVLYLYTYPLRFEQVQLEVEIPEPILLPSLGFTSSHREILCRLLDLYGCCSEPVQESASLLVTLVQREQQLHITMDFMGKLRWNRFREELRLIKEAWERLGTELQCLAESENEHVLELKFSQDGAGKEV